MGKKFLLVENVLVTFNFVSIYWRATYSNSDAVPTLFLRFSSL